MSSVRLAEVPCRRCAAGIPIAEAAKSFGYCAACAIGRKPQRNIQ